MTNQQGAEALAHELYTAAQLAPGEGVLDAVARLAALVEAQQPAAHVQNPAEIEHVAGDVSKNWPGSNMAQQPAPSAAAAGIEATIGSIMGAAYDFRDAHLCGSMNEKRSAHAALDSAVRQALAPQPSPTPQADSQPAPDNLRALFREALAWGMVYGPEIPAYQWDEMRESMVKQYTSRAARAPADSVTAPAGGGVAGPSKWTVEEILDGNRGIRWVTEGVIHGRPTDHDVREYLMRTPAMRGCHCDDCKTFYAPTPPAQAADSVLEDAARLDWLQENSCDLRCIGVPTGGDDYDINWIVVEHHQATPHEREIGRSYTDDPRVAIDAARKQGANHD